MKEFDSNNIEDIKTSMYIEASAGTGKTYTITKLIQKLLSDGIKLEEILVVTYTEKAVGELRDRIRKNCPDQDVDAASIYTIHSFCQKTLSEFAFTANQCESLSVTGDDAFDSFIEGWIRDKMTKEEDFKELYENSSAKESLINSISSSIKQSIKNYYLNSAGEEDKSIVSLDEIYFIKNDRKYSYEECDQLLEQAEQDYASVKKDYKAVFSELDSKANIGKLADYKKIRFIRNQIKKIYMAWQQEKEKNKMQSYDDMLRSVREAVCNPSSNLKEQLRKKYKYAIIDEFQDTNQRQWDIFKNIFMGDDKHKIIVVGDPKQSIYSFQGADVNVYRNAINTISAEGGQAYSLSTNFRSTKEMVEVCNLIFKEKDDGKITFFDPDSQISFNHSNPSGKILSAKYQNEIIKPLWLAGNEEKRIKPEEFAKIAVNQIIDCCTVENGKTRLQIFDKDKKDYRNVSFRDFAILARTATEMPEIEYALQKAGIPFLHYKDKKLFTGLECKHWLSLINAIIAKDFTGYKRPVLSEALFSVFFNVPIDDIEDESFDNPLCPERQKILQWQQLAQQRKWAKLFEKIYADTNIENRLSKLDKMQSLAKYRQIGNYALSYLYKNDSSLEDFSRHLSRLSLSADEGDDSLVERGTDFDCVQIMTIHASKGLEFPVVICPGGFKGKNNQIPNSYLYHDEEKKARLSLCKSGKEKMFIEQEYEWQRIFYVAYTRASALLILPFYESWEKNFSYLNNNIKALFGGAGKNYIKEIKESNKKYEELQKEVQTILLGLKKIREENKEALADLTEAQQAEKAGELSQRLPGLALTKHSYSSLSHKKADTALLTETGERSDKDGSSQQPQGLSAMDASENPVPYKALPEEADIVLLPEAGPENYPKGKKLGIALHEVFEKADFVRAGQEESCQAAQSNEELKELIKACFEKQTFLIPDKDPNHWLAYTASMLWNTLNARLPEITGTKASGRYFSLKEIANENRISEAEFNINADYEKFDKDFLKNYCNGFMDLVFCREVDGKELYSILDWKSDFFAAQAYSNERELSSHTNNHYSIQRVLYSYSLVKWLSSFYKDESEEEIFEKHFGGIYYVYVRGCIAGSCSGIYARSWKSWQELEKAFRNIFREYQKKD